MTPETLITPNEVVKYSPISGHSDAKLYCNIIRLKEEKLFNECLGADFYQDLLADKNILPANIVEFNQQTSYTAGDFVEFEAVIYEVIQNTDGSQNVCQSDYFVPYPKFANADYQVLWDTYLLFLLAFTMAYAGTTYNAISSNASGLILKKGENFDAATVKHLGMFKAEFEGHIRDILNNMDKFIMKPENEAKYPSYKGWQNNGNCGCGNGVCKERESNVFGFNLYTNSDK